MLTTLQAVKHCNSKVITMAYMNSLLNFPNYALASSITADNGRLATRDDTGAIIRFQSDGGRGDCNMLAFDWSASDARAAWLAIGNGYVLPAWSMACA